MFFDPLYLIVMIPVLILSGIASATVKGTFSKYSKTRTSTGMTGAEAAQRMLHRAGVTDVRIEQVSGFLSDHYDPRKKVLRLSPEVYGESSIAAVGVACHEAGHALQHAQGYAPLKLRTALVPITQFGSNFGLLIAIAGIMLAGIGFIAPETGFYIAWAGVILFGTAFVFSVVTLPVEWDASARAKKQLAMCGAVTSQAEIDAAGKVLNAAFMTYVAGAISALLQLIYYLVRFGLIGGRRD
jgi:Zn-dependent membrane protease YugP